MKETALQFGAQRNLFGIVAEPVAPVPVRQEAPVIVLLNAGLLHHVGPFRAWVTLARRLAARGYVAFRFDLAGLGDSEVERRNGSDQESAVADIRAALDTLQARYGARRFLLLGLCSGADNAHPAALADPRIAGLIMLDGYGYHTLSYYLVHYLPRLIRPDSWRRFMKSALGSLRAKAREDARQVTFVRDFPPRQQACRELQEMVDRGVEFLYVYTAGVGDYYNHRGQFRSMFSALRDQGRVQVEYYPVAEHTYEFPEDRERMFARVEEWIESRRWGGT